LELKYFSNEVFMTKINGVLAVISAIGMSVFSGAGGAQELGGLQGSASARAIAPRLAVGRISPSLTYANSSFATGGTGLRNRLLATIHVSGGLTAR
jgi:hypothetical protein